MDQLVPLTKKTMVELISHAKIQVVYTAPAMDNQVAIEIVEFAKRTCIDQVAVTLDLSADVYREGFGDEDALYTLENGGLSVNHIQGLRVGVLLVDEKGWIFSPLSKITSERVVSDQKNAVLQEKHNSLLDVYVNMPIEPEQVNMFGTENEDFIFKDTVKQEETFYKERIVQVKKALKEQPAPNFDLQRLLSEFRCLIQFVEITFKGARLGQTTVKIPSELLNVTKKKGFEEKMKASYQLFNEDFVKYTKPLKDEVDEFRERYTHALSKKYGRVILIKNKVEFENEYQTINKKIEQHKIDLNNQINEQIQRTKNELIDYFTPVIMENPPEQLLQGDMDTLKEQEVKSYIEWILGREFPTSEQILKRFEFYHLYKDITEEILKDEQFYRELERAFKGEYMNWPHQKQYQEEFSFLI